MCQRVVVGRGSVGIARKHMHEMRDSNEKTSKSPSWVRDFISQERSASLIYCRVVLVCASVYSHSEVDLDMLHAALLHPETSLAWKGGFAHQSKFIPRHARLGLVSLRFNRLRNVPVQV